MHDTITNVASTSGKMQRYPYKKSCYHSKVKTLYISMEIAAQSVTELQSRAPVTYRSTIITSEDTAQNTHNVRQWQVSQLVLLIE